MKTRLLALLLIFAAALHRAAADEWISEEYRCAMTIPTQESWTATTRQQLPNGEIILHAVSMATSQGIMITFVPDMPSADLRNPVLVKRIAELLESQGWSTESPTQVIWKKRPYLQFAGRRKDTVFGKLIGIARATMRGRNLYVVTAYGRGEADRANDAGFMRVMETFRFIDQPILSADHPEGPPATSYRIAMIGAGSAAALLLVAFATVLFLSWRATEERA